MGVIQRQSIRIVLVSYLGVIIGAINTLFVYPQVLGAEKHGLVMLLLSIATVLAQFLHLGVPNTLIRFYPYFKDQKKYIHRMALQLPLMSLLLFSLFFFLLHDSIFAHYSLKSKLFGDYQTLVYPLLVNIVFFEVLLSISRSELKTVFPAILREFLLRVMTLGLLGLYFFEYIDFSTFMILWIIAYAFNVFALSVYLLINNSLIISFGKTMFPDPVLGNKMKKYGLVTLLTASASIFVNRIDILMLGYFLNLENIAFYTVAFFMASLLQIPARAILQVAKPILAKAWKINDREEIQMLYQKSALNQMIIGTYVFICIWLNLDEILLLVPKSYQGVQYVFLFVGLAKLCDVASGVNGAIISTSDHYRFDLYINSLLILISVITNIIFIPKFGITGAAFATFISCFLYNFVKWFLLRRWYKFQPFDLRFVFIIVLSLIIVCFDLFIGQITEFIILQISIKLTLISIVFLVPIFVLNISPDINDWIVKQIKNIS
ncbi:MAG: Uncharacterised protein [Flavobacteriaceae bacterium]|nr:MAG: Uncharacterised protein [Flavobacteriaceae bacterium]|tara:strand:- start:441 stop:1913 length:1473 start_codon:yes stop_codon:yes gene_type:complete